MTLYHYRNEWRLCSSETPDASDAILRTVVSTEERREDDTDSDSHFNSNENNNSSAATSEPSGVFQLFLFPFCVLHITQLMPCAILVSSPLC